MNLYHSGNVALHDNLDQLWERERERHRNVDQALGEESRPCLFFSTILSIFLFVLK